MKEIIENIDAIRLILLAFTSYSVTRLVVTDDFPPVVAIRNWLFHRFPHDDYTSDVRPVRGEPRRVSNGVWVVTQGHWIGNLISCPWCFGFWASVAVFAAFLFLPYWLFALGAYPFALRAFVGGYASRIGHG